MHLLIAINVGRFEVSVISTTSIISLTRRQLLYSYRKFVMFRYSISVFSRSNLG